MLRLDKISDFKRELVTLKEIFQSNGYPIPFIDKCFKKFLDRLHIKNYFSNSGKKPLGLVLPYLGPIYLQARIKIRNAMKDIMFKHYANMFRFKDRVPYVLVSGVVYECTCGSCNSSYYCETERYL